MAQLFKIRLAPAGKLSWVKQDNLFYNLLAQREETELILQFEDFVSISYIKDTRK